MSLLCVRNEWWNPGNTIPAMQRQIARKKRRPVRFERDAAVVDQTGLSSKELLRANDQPHLRQPHLRCLPHGVGQQTVTGTCSQTTLGTHRVTVYGTLRATQRGTLMVFV